MLPLTAPSSPPPAFSSENGEALMALARAAAAGDNVATRRLLNAVSPPMTRVIAGVLGATHPDLEDVVQQSLIGLVRALGAFRGECHPLGYASRIALHIALRARRRSSAERVRTRALAEGAPAKTPLPLPSDEFESEGRRTLLRDLLQDLPEEQAETLALRIMLGWSLEEVALATGAPVNTVRSRVRLGKEALRRRIEESPGLAEDLGVHR